MCFVWRRAQKSSAFIMSLAQLDIFASADLLSLILSRPVAIPQLSTHALVCHHWLRVIKQHVVPSLEVEESKEFMLPTAFKAWGGPAQKEGRMMTAFSTADGALEWGVLFHRWQDDDSPDGMIAMSIFVPDRPRLLPTGWVRRAEITIEVTVSSANLQAKIMLKHAFDGQHSIKAIQDKDERYLSQMHPSLTEAVRVGEGLHFRVTTRVHVRKTEAHPHATREISSLFDPSTGEWADGTLPADPSPLSWKCDACFRSPKTLRDLDLEDGGRRSTRYRCCEGCDYDLCRDCQIALTPEAQ